MRKRIDLSDAEVERILSTEEEVVPSSRFSANVMHAVEHEAALRASRFTAPSTPFPWRIFLLGVSACLALPCLMLVLALLSPAQANVAAAAQPHWAQMVAMLVEKYVAFATALPPDWQQVSAAALHHAVQMDAVWLLLMVLFICANVRWSARA